jgi:hypothetical protein
MKQFESLGPTDRAALIAALLEAVASGARGGIGEIAAAQMDVHRRLTIRAQFGQDLSGVAHMSQRSRRWA